MRNTSIEAYMKIKESGLLSKLRFQVYDIIYNNGSMTASEMINTLHNVSNSGAYATRLSELERLGVVAAIGKRKCKISGFMAIEWDVTGNLPIKPPKRKSKKLLKIDILNRITSIASTLNDDNQLQDLREIYKLVAIV